MYTGSILRHEFCANLETNNKARINLFIFSEKKKRTKEDSQTNLISKQQILAATNSNEQKKNFKRFI